MSSNSLRQLYLLAALWLALGGGLLLGQTPRDRAVELTAVVQQVPPTITLQWNTTGYAVTSQTVSRRVKNTPPTNWVALPAPTASAVSYTDTNVTVGTSYEYRVVRNVSGGPGTAYGYVMSGIRVPVVVDRGRVILVVDDTMVAPLAAELTRLTADLMGDGWTVIRLEVARTATPTSVRSSIRTIYNGATPTTRAVILFGRIPVPYAGETAIDGHFPDHQGAWPADLYYGEMTSSSGWTDDNANVTGASDPRNHNVPGDGKFDQTIIPSDVELQVGRIDFANMPSFGASETELLRRYLDRDHAYRHNLGAFANVGRRGLVDDHFGYFGGEAFAVSAWRSFTACVGAGNVEALDWFETLQTQSYLWAYGCGGGSYQGAGGVGSSGDFATKDSLAVFTLLFGSYFGDWDTSDAFLRAPLAGTVGSLGLVSCWAGRPQWFFHPMALGETVGYSARLTQNNQNTTQRGYDANYGARYAHVALMGDPTLRLYPVSPPTNISAMVSANAVTLNWSVSPDTAIEGYLVLRAGSAAGPFVLVSNGTIADPTFTDANVTPGQSYVYLVRAVKAETSPTGTYLNSSQGAYSASVIAGVASGPEIDLSGNGNLIVSGSTTPLTANGTDFGSVEIAQGVTRTFTIANVGMTTLNVSSFQIAGTHPQDFVLVQAPPATLAAGGNANFQLRFQPTATGPRVATVTLTSDDADEGSFQFAIGGNALPASAGMAIYPPAINRSIHPGSTVTETLNISNPAFGTLTHTISSSQARYSARDSNAFGGPAYEWVDISTTGTQINNWTDLDDAISDPIALGFSFPFYGASFSEVRICTNGFLSFTDTETSARNSALPNTNAAANMIAPLWGDLVVNNGGQVYWQVVGGRFIVQFDKVQLFENGDARLTFQVILRPNGEVNFQYHTLTGFGGNYTVGLQNGARDDGLLLAYNAPYVQPGLAIRIRPPGLETWLSLSANGGTVLPGEAQQIDATLNAAGLASGDYYAELLVASNAPGQESVIIPVRLTVGNTPIENWRFQHFGILADSGDAADSANIDGDAGHNLLEYALTRDPQTPEVGPLTVTEVNAGGYLQIQFSRDATRTDLRYIVEATTDLAAAWTTIASGVHGAAVIAAGAHSCIESGAGDVKTVIVEDSAPATSFPTRYLRLRIVRD